ncbi:hypothetical protein Slala03_28470 [Streptomyces lavendulae subsp. lavendulae]|uniref:hypothetical protein n=1 Tax=Streptomyces lavendulae TaxID=1914 RepID=UPI0024A552B9|nr:hypothetical protein [Streptomyces lavendulae]GLV83158.1 hypothetical protein Slala03_28470 [Streptomyces lavendulae subsp. lavendulae]
MNDPSTLAATAHDDRDGPPLTPDPTPADASDGARDPAAGAPPVTAPAAPPAPTPPPPEPGPGAGNHPEPHNEPMRTLLETAATCRPVEEVTALVSLLKQTGQPASPGHDALRAAAVARPVHEVRRMVALLAEQPQEEAEADITLRAAAVGRSIEDVALLASILGPEKAPDGLPEGPPEGLPGGPPDGLPDGLPGGPFGGAPAALRPTRPPLAPPPPPERRPVPAAPPGPVTAPARDRGALRHVLRWPTAAALLLCGALHLPQDLAAALPAGDPARWTAPAAALLCLLVGALLAVRDTAVVWRVSAVAALAVVTLHVVGGVVFFDPLLGALGGAYPWAGVTAVLCSGAGAVLAGLALMHRPPHTGTGGTA